MTDSTSPADDLRDALRMFAEAYASLPDEAIEQYRERLEWRIDEGWYDAVLHTPDGGAFNVGPVNVWGKSLVPEKQNVDLPIERVPAHLRDEGLGECELTIHSSDGAPLLSGPLRDDGNRQDGLNCICVAVEYSAEEREETGVDDA